MLEGRPFTLYSDHQSLVPSIHKKSDPQTARQQYQLAGIAEYTTDVRYIQGKANVVADHLSRPAEESSDANAIAVPEHHPFVTAMIEFGIIEAPTISIPAPANDTKVSSAATEDLHDVIYSIGNMGINLEEMARDRPMDPEYRQLSANARSGLNMKRVQLETCRIIVDVSNGPAQPFVPLAWRRRVFNVIHGLGHPGVH